MPDRHGRLPRSDGDLRRRPADGFRAATAGRFRRLLHESVRTAPIEVRQALRNARIEVVDVPDPDAVAVAEVTGDLPLARYLSSPTSVCLLVYRRAVEMRASSRASLVEVLRAAIEDAVGEAGEPPPSSLEP